MKPVIVALLVLVVLAGVVPAEEEDPSGVSPEIISAMGRNALIAGWMAGYDVAAWYSGDEFMKEQSQEKGRVRSWFCYPGDDGWHAVYGCLDKEKGTYERLFHYLVVSPKDVRKVADLTAGESDVALATAYHDSGPRVRARMEALRCRFNPYLRQTEDAVEVWAHPNVANDWTIVYGLAYCWTYSLDGTEFKSEKSYGGKLFGIKGQKEHPVVIGDPETEFPAVSEMYVVERFGYLFERIGVQSKTGVSYRMSGGMWTHVVTGEESAEDEPDAPVEPADTERPIEDESEPDEPEPEEPEPDEPD